MPQRITASLLNCFCLVVDCARFECVFVDACVVCTTVDDDIDDDDSGDDDDAGFG